MALSSFMNFVAHSAGTASLGAHGLTWDMVHANRAYTQQLITPSSLLRIGDMDPSLGTIREWWRIDAGNITPTGDRSIGSSTAPVQSIAAKTVSADNLSLIYESAPFICFQLTNFGSQSVPTTSLNLAITTQNDIAPLSPNVLVWVLRELAGAMPTSAELSWTASPPRGAP